MHAILDSDLIRLFKVRPFDTQGQVSMNTGFAPINFNEMMILDYTSD